MAGEVAFECKSYPSDMLLGDGVGRFRASESGELVMSRSFVHEGCRYKPAGYLICAPHLF